MPVVAGLVGDSPVKVLRDTGCSSVIVREDLVAEDQKLQEWTTLILADGTVRIIPLAKVSVSTPYLTGEVKALCVKTPVYDLIIGNVKGARDAEDPDPEWRPETCAVTTRSQARKSDQTIPLKVASSPEAAVVDRAKLVELQKADPTLTKLKSQTKPVTRKGREITFQTHNDILYRICSSRGNTTTHQVVVPEPLRLQVMKLAHDSILGGHLGINKTLDRIQGVFYWPDPILPVL
ncbi:hypothetical protein BaRGS_00024469 [Batillaria attramentaria]|uniref:Integrase zinc-binding domain-containing protein n=1 Tax=Batillaria attramentaria TaxID=370345 RepID=A0ABD0KB44_9CAEN